MGGYSSGRRGGKSTTDDMHVLDIRKIQRAGLLVLFRVCAPILRLVIFLLFQIVAVNEHVSPLVVEICCLQLLLPSTVGLHSRSGCIGTSVYRPGAPHDAATCG